MESLSGCSWNLPECCLGSGSACTCPYAIVYIHTWNLLLIYLEPVNMLYFGVCPFHSKRGSFEFYVHIDMGPMKPRIIF